MIDKATSFDIAARAGVSQPTVSKALRGDRSVNAETRRRIEAIARDLNYIVDKRASTLRGGASNTLALLFFEDAPPDGSMINPFFLAMLGSILQMCARRGYDLLTSFQSVSSDWYKDFEDSHRADGIILLGYGDYQRYRVRLEQLLAHGARFVRWGAVEAAAVGVTIGCDNLAGGRVAVEHLLSRGRRHIAFLGNTDGDFPEFRDRYRGMNAALVAAGYAVDPMLLEAASFTEPSGYAAIKRLLERGAIFDAVFAASDMVAIGGMRALREAGLSIPDDVAVVGFDDVPAASVASTQLTTVAQDFCHAGEVLVSALVDIIHGRPVQTELLSPTLIVRQSS